MNSLSRILGGGGAFSLGRCILAFANSDRFSRPFPFKTKLGFKARKGKVSRNREPKRVEGKFTFYVYFATSFKKPG